MDSRNIMLPTIDFSSKELKPGTSTWESVKAQVGTALEEFGCFHALFDKVTKESRKEMFDSTAELFDLPLQDKERNKANRDYHGYIGPMAGRPLYESLGIDDATSPQMVESFKSTVWPQGKSNFSQTVQCFIEPLTELDRTIRTMVLESLRLEKYMDEHMNSAEYILRFNKYAAANTNGTEVGLSSHKDTNLVTILDEEGTNGLQVLTKDDQWIQVNFSPNSFFVFIGQTFHAWTNGRLHTPNHKVMMSGKDERYTVGVFSDFKQGYIVEVPDELVDEEHPKLFKPFEVSGLLAFQKAHGHKYPSPIKAYCGI